MFGSCFYEIYIVKNGYFFLLLIIYFTWVDFIVFCINLLLTIFTLVYFCCFNINFIIELNKFCFKPQNNL